MNISQEQIFVFLDIDGVLDIYQPDVEIQDFLPNAINNLCCFVHRTKAKIIFISSHRCGSKNWDMLLNILKENNICDVDITPCSEEYHTRTNEIKAYLDSNPEVTRYVIFDDCYQDDYLSDSDIHKHLVFVDALKGLQEEDILKSYMILNNM